MVVVDVHDAICDYSDVIAEEDPVYLVHKAGKSVRRPQGHSKSGRGHLKTAKRETERERGRKCASRGTASSRPHLHSLPTSHIYQKESHSTTEQNV